MLDIIKNIAETILAIVSIPVILIQGINSYKELTKKSNDDN